MMRNPSIPSTEEIGTYYDELIAQGIVTTLSVPTRETIIDVVAMSLAVPSFTTLSSGETVEVLFSPETTIEEKAEIAIGELLGLYGAWLDVNDPITYARFVRDPEFLPAVITVGCLTAALEERGRIQREVASGQSAT